MLTLLWLLSKDFRLFITTRLKRVGREGLETYPSASEVAKVPAASVEEPTKPKSAESETVSLEESAEEGSFLQKLITAAKERDIEEIDSLYEAERTSTSSDEGPETLAAYWIFARKMAGDASLLKELTKLHEKHEAWTFPSRQLFWHYLNVGSHNMAEKYAGEFEKRAQSWKEKAISVGLWADIREARGDRSGAIKYIETKLSDFEDKVGKKELYSKISELYEREGDSAQQKRYLELALTVDTDDEEVRFKLAYKYGESTEYDEILMSCHHYQIIIEMNPRHSSALNNLSINLRKLEAKKEADNLIFRAINEHSDTAWKNYIVELINAGFFKEAQEKIEEVPSEMSNNKEIASAITYLDNKIESEEEKEKDVKASREIVFSMYQKLIEGNNIELTPSEIEGEWVVENERGALSIMYKEEMNSIVGSFNFDKVGYSTFGHIEKFFIIMYAREKEKEPRGLLSIRRERNVKLMKLKNGRLYGLIWEGNKRPVTISMRRKGEE